MQADEWGDIVTINWNTCLRAWKAMSLPTDANSLAERTGDQLFPVMLKLIGDALDDEQAAENFAVSLGEALATVSLDALMETMFYACQLLEQALERAGVAEIPQISALAELNDATPEPTLLKFLERRHNEPFARLLASWYANLPESLPMVVSVLIANIHLLVGKIDPSEEDTTPEYDRKFVSAITAIEKVVESAIVDYVASNRYLMHSLLDPSEQSQLGDADGFVICAQVSKENRINIRLLELTTLTVG
jgi:hypothetical protein